MALLSVIVFLGVFAVAALLLVASRGDSFNPNLTLAALDLNTDDDKGKSPRRAADFRKSVVLSAIPWMNRLLLKFELARGCEFFYIKLISNGLLVDCFLCP